jgi:exoribonuclease-2
MDLITLDIHGTVVERLDVPAPDGSVLEGAGDDAPDDEEVSGPIAIAVDVNEAPLGDAS